MALSLIYKNANITKTIARIHEENEGTKPH